MAVAVTEPKSLPNPNLSPERVHESIVQGLNKNYVAQGYRAERSMTRETRGGIPSSTAVYLLPDGKRAWITVFTLVSASEVQVTLLVSDGEDLQRAYLPTVRAMLGDVGGR